MNRIFTILSLSLLMMMGMADGQTHLWGTCTGGGLVGSGSIFMTDANGQNLHSVFSFDASINDIEPIGSLVFASGKFYGIAHLWDTINSYSCYSFDPASG